MIGRWSSCLASRVLANNPLGFRKLARVKVRHLQGRWKHKRRMGATLYEIDTVVVGRFNPHIISPPWLAKESIIATGETVQAEIAVAGKAIAFRFRTGDLTWQVDFNRLMISAEKLLDTATIAAKVVEKLPHTPLTAIGSNFRYRCNLSQWKGRLPKLDDVGVDQLKEYGDVQSVGWKASINRPDGATLNVEVSLEPGQSLSPMLTANVNCHRQVNDAKMLIAAAQRFEDDRQSSATLIESLLREKVES